MSLVGVEALGGLNSFSVGISLVVSVASKSMEILFRAPIFFTMSVDKTWKHNYCEVLAINPKKSAHIEF